MRLLCVVVVAIGIAGSAVGAEISLGGNGFMGCIATLDGPIESGDADKLRTTIDTLAKRVHAAYLEDHGLRPEDTAERSFGFARLCLNSPGGSLQDALKMADMLYEARLGTAIAREGSCQSACAFVFIGGTSDFAAGYYARPNRLLHAAGKLGFHAPALVVPEGNYTKQQVQRAYDIAIKGLGAISQRKHDWILPDGILDIVLNTPSSQMHFVDTTFEAGRLGVTIVGTYLPDEMTKLAAANACDKEFAFKRDTDLTFSENWPAAPKAGTRIGKSAKTKLLEDGLELRVGGYPDLQVCTVEYRPLKGRDPSRPLFDRNMYRAPGDGATDEAHFAQVGWFGGDLQARSAASFFDGRLPLRTIARAQDDVQAYRSVVELTAPDLDRTVDGDCSVWRGESQIDFERCAMQERVETTSALVTRTSRTFTWPSGAKTVVIERSAYATNTLAKVNGREAEGIYDWNNPPVPEGLCWLNKGSGNTFCFLESGA